jgi:hypothetical protein
MGGSGWSKPHPSLFTCRKGTWYLSYRMLDGPQGPFWRGVENFFPTGIRSQDRPAHSKSLYWVHYPGPGLKFYSIFLLFFSFLFFSFLFFSFLFFSFLFFSFLFFSFLFFSFPLPSPPLPSPPLPFSSLLFSSLLFSSLLFSSLLFSFCFSFPFLSFPFLSFPFLSFPFLSFPFLSFLYLYLYLYVFFPCINSLGSMYSPIFEYCELRDSHGSDCEDDCLVTCDLV